MSRFNQAAMWAAHDQEARERGAEFYNYGWAMTHRGIASKTDKGILDTEWDKRHKTYVHTWTQRSDIMPVGLKGKKKMVRTVENWKKIMHGKRSHEIARFLLGDLTHYHCGRAYEQDDASTVANLLVAYVELQGMKP